ncbi:outer membrane protein insertion porin family [Dysgonomonas sp. PH5-45]|uniref:outer membrane protein assembly factor BamA n=1 Tax=unclassified Dysgonomonas TaxID=2630389 RepID=UPI002473AECB|nr:MULTISPECIES: outer membrane protein assembly factor BamA [unclassified Dysgonomonas]MDH6354153.1 outer membrane protein insertion porin family [Dysgonomonas sp. PH5-45]MDH6386996.1 outer membrane protein insertion porin family [Dysgonomonas sp. PH5-37]
MFKKGLLLLSAICAFGINVFAQNTDSVSVQSINNAISADVKAAENNVPVISYSLNPMRYEIAGIQVSGVDNPASEEFILIGISGLNVGDKIEIPGTEITNAVRRYWRNGFFSEVKILATKIEGNKIWLEIRLKNRPRVSDIRFYGLKGGEKKDLQERLGVVKGNQITPNDIDATKKVIKRYLDDKGFTNAVINVSQKEDPAQKNQVFLDIDINKKNKIKVHTLTIEGNKEVSTSALEKSMKKTRHKSTLKAWFRNFLRSTKYVPESYEADKENLIAKYNELGYRDARIVSDTVTRYKEDKVDIHLKIDEGQKYHIRNIDWIGNTVYPSEMLQRYLNMKSGDVYNQKKLFQNLREGEESLGNSFYYNKGYMFYDVDPVEVNIEKDSIDLEIRIREGEQATIRRVGISGNDRLYEDVVRRELRTKPGALFSREDLLQTYREIAQTGHFDPERLNPEVNPSPEDGVVDIDWNLASKANDQVEFSAGWGQTGIIGRLSLKFTNFSLKNLFNKGSYKGILPQGEGQTLTLSAQTNASYYQSYSISFTDPWFGGKRPNSLSVGAYYSVQSGVNSNYYNSSTYGNYYNDNYNDYSYQNSLDPDKSMKTLGASIAYGKRLSWPDNYFYAQVELSYQRYQMKDWTYYFLVKNGVCNNLSLNFSIMRNTLDNPLYTRRGTEYSLSLQITPPFSAFDGKDYKNMQRDEEGYEPGAKFKWIEYHKWKFKSKTYIPLLPSNPKTPVLMTRTEFGLVGYFNKHKKSLFETFYVGGDGMSGSYSNYAIETIALRGYENGALGSQASAYSRLGLELRYPLILEPSSTIYLVGFVEGGNAWDDIKDINPFELKRSAGFGARIMLPMIGLMGIDWAYGFDPINGSRSNSGSQLHFIMGREF